MNGYRSLVAGCFCLIGFNSLLVAGEPRTWTDVSGNKIVGELVDVTSNHHALLRVEDEMVSIPFTIFSQEDQKYLKSRQKESTNGSSDPVSQPSTDSDETSKPKTDPQESSSDRTEDETDNVSSPVITPDNYVPPKWEPELAYFCTNCDHELSASVGVGDHCPHCNILLEYEEDENGKVIAGKKDIPWYWRAGIRIAATVVVAGLAGLWKLRHLILLPSRSEQEQFEMPVDNWQKST